MDKYKKYYGLALFLVVALLLTYLCVNTVMPTVKKNEDLIQKIEQKTNTLKTKQEEKRRVETRIKDVVDSIANSQKKIYSPSESDLGNDSLFFTLYNDIIEMFQANAVKIKQIDYSHNPPEDKFVKSGKDLYFVCDINAEIVSNYLNLGRLIQDIYQYPYYIKINSLETKSYHKDKKILLTKLSLRLYARTEPEVTE